MGPWKKCTVRLEFANKNMLHSGSPKSICVYIFESIAIPIGVECRCIIELAEPDSSMYFYVPDIPELAIKKVLKDLIIKTHLASLLKT